MVCEFRSSAVLILWITPISMKNGLRKSMTGATRRYTSSASKTAAKTCVFTRALNAELFRREAMCSMR